MPIDKYFACHVLGNFDLLVILHEGNTVQEAPLSEYGTFQIQYTLCCHSVFQNLIMNYTATKRRKAILCRRVPGFNDPPSHRAGKYPYLTFPE